METRKQVEKIILIPITVNFERLTFKSIKEAKNILDTDEIIGVADWEQENTALGGDFDDIHCTGLKIKRLVPETDDEFFKRVKEKEDMKKRFEEREKLEYLRLKAKYEN